MNKLLVRWTLETMLDVHRTGSFYLLSVLYRQCLLQGMRIVWGHDDRAIAIVDRFHADEAAPFALIQIADGVSGLFDLHHGLRRTCLRQRRCVSTQDRAAQACGANGRCSQPCLGRSQVHHLGCNADRINTVSR